MQRVTIYEVSKREDTIACDYREFHENPSLWPARADWHLAPGNASVDPTYVRSRRVQEPVQHFKDGDKSFYICIGPELRELLESATESRLVRQTRDKAAKDNERLRAIICSKDDDLVATKEILRVTNARAQCCKEERLVFKSLPWYVRAWRAARNQL